MTQSLRMIETNPSPALVDSSTLAECIDACFECAQTCSACADACLSEGDLEMLACCIRLDLDCAQACRLCGEEREQRAQHHEHCRICAELCRRCESACNNVLSAVEA